MSSNYETIYSQKDTINPQRKGRFLIGINPFLTNKPEFDNYGSDLIRGRNLISGEIYGSYLYQLNNNWSLKASLGIGELPIGMKYKFNNQGLGNFPKENYSILEGKIAVYPELPGLYAYLSVGLEWKAISFQHNYLFLGIDFRFYRFLFDDYSRSTALGYSYEGSQLTQEEETLFMTKFHNYKKNSYLNVSIQMDLGYSFVYKNNQELRMSLALNYSPFKRYQGYYLFKNLGVNSHGTYVYGINNLGIKVEWIFGRKMKID